MKEITIVSKPIYIYSIIQLKNNIMYSLNYSSWPCLCTDQPGHAGHPVDREACPCSTSPLPQQCYKMRANLREWSEKR